MFDPMHVHHLHCPACEQNTRVQWLGESIFSGREAETLTTCRNPACIAFKRPLPYDLFMAYYGPDPCTGPVFHIHTRRLNALFAQAGDTREVRICEVKP